MLFIYIAIVCFGAAGIITYTGSITIAINSKTLFDDLKRLGANKEYINNCIKAQLKKMGLTPIGIDK